MADDDLKLDKHFVVCGSAFGEADHNAVMLLRPSPNWDHIVFKYDNKLPIATFMLNIIGQRTIRFENEFEVLEFLRQSLAMNQYGQFTIHSAVPIQICESMLEVSREHDKFKKFVPLFEYAVEFRKH